MVVDRLSIVMPAHNEAAVIGGVIDAVRREILDRAADAQLIIIDDASTDATSEIVRRAVAGDERIVVLRNDRTRGHGPSLRRGLEAARGDWILQMDSDDEVDPAAFASLWSARATADVVLGRRTGRDQPLARRCLSAAAACGARIVAGRRIGDANTPFRLSEAGALRAAMPLVDRNAFAPNVLFAIAIARRGGSIVDVPVAHRARRSGQSSLRGPVAVRAAARSAVQLAILATRLVRTARQR